MSITADTEYKRFVIDSLAHYFPDIDHDRLAMAGLRALRERGVMDDDHNFVESVRAILGEYGHNYDRWSYTHDHVDRMDHVVS